jgi:hypothetical protein
MKTKNMILLIIGIICALSVIFAIIYYCFPNIIEIEGKQGIQGEKGEAGINGTNGANGNKGKTGASGSTGASGQSIIINPNKTIVAGIISINKIGGTPLSDVDVFISCKGNLMYALTKNDGAYGVSYSQDICKTGDEVTILANKGNLTGKAKEIVIDDDKTSLDFVVINTFVI